MDKAAVLKILDRYRIALERHGVRNIKVILFGSYAKGDAREDSDIDVVIVSETFRGKGYWEKIEILSKGIMEVFEPIEAVAMTPEEWEKSDSFIAAFAREGEVVFG